MLKIVTLNLNYFVEKHGLWPIRKKLIIQQLEETDPDVVFFQAVARHPDLYGGQDQARQISSGLSKYKYHTFDLAQSQPDGTHQGNAIISKFALSKTTCMKLNLLPDLSDTNKRLVQHAAITTAGKTFNLYNAHFSWVEVQAMQNAEQATQFITEQSPGFTILAGDLNTAPDSKVFEIFKTAGLTDAWQIIHADKAGYTFESDNPSSRIDYFWISTSLSNQLRNVQVIATSPDEVRLSDHLGLMIELDI